MKGFDEKWLRDHGLEKQDDDTYKKKKRPSGKKKGTSTKGGQVSLYKEEGSDTNIDGPIDKRVYRFYEDNESGYRYISLVLLGTPIPKQSAKFYAFMSNGKPKVRSYQPDKYKDRVKDYQRQIMDQLPDDFEMFENEVIIEEYTVVFPPLKGFSKRKMDFIKSGGFIKKTTNPDLPDNLKKLALDSMSKLVFKDDGLIWQECNTLKVHGTGGCIIIRLKGK